METFEQSWPEGFHDTIPRKEVTMSVGRKSMKIGDAKVFDTERMYARAMALQAGSHSLNINDIISLELALTLPLCLNQMARCMTQNQRHASKIFSE